jgi:fructokinase
MATWGMDAQGVEDDPSHPTGEVRVTFVAGEPRYTILEDRAYDHIALARMPPGPVSLVYHGTLALRGARSRQALATLRCSLPAPAFVDVNLRDPWWDLPTVAAALDGARWGKLNEEELARLAGPGDPGTAARRLLSRHNLEWVFVTRGATGAFALSRRGEHHAVTPSPAAAIVDTVGAGDAFAAAVIAGLLRGWPVPRTLARAQALASAVCGLRGAIPRDPAFYAGLGDDPEVRTGGRFPQGH